MDKNIVPYKETLSLFEVGFRFLDLKENYVNCFSTNNHPSLVAGILIGLNPSEPLMESNMSKIGVWNIPALLYQQAFRWLREKHNLTFTIKRCFNCYNITEVLIYDPVIDANSCVDMKGLEWKDFKNYENAEIACLRFLINNVKKKK